MKKFLFLFLLFLRATAFSQAPNITYGTPPVFTIGATISALTPTNSGGAVAGQSGVTTFTGINDNSGFANGALASATFNNPQGMIFDPAGNMYVADFGNKAIRKISTTGVVSTFATTNNASPVDMAMDASGNIFVCSQSSTSIQKITPGGVVSTFYTSGNPATMLFNPIAMVFDASGNLCVLDNGKGDIFKITPSGVLSTFVTGLQSVFDMELDASGNFYVSQSYLITSQFYSKMLKISPIGVVSIFVGGMSGNSDGTGISASFSGINGMALDAAGNIYCTDQGNSKIRKVTPSGVVTSVTGGPSYGYLDGPLNTAQFYGPSRMAIDQSGNLYVSSHYIYLLNAIRKISFNNAYTISPSLPAGLIFNNGTGEISGTPTMASAATTYTVTATNASGTSTHTMSMSVVCSSASASSSTTTKTIVASFLPYTWNGLTFSAVGSQTAHLTNHLGCDSAATLTLSLAPAAAALHLDGVDDYIELPATINNAIGNNITLEGWFNLGAGTTNAVSLIGEGYLGDGNIKFVIFRESNQIKAGFVNGSFYQTAAALPASGWVHIAATYDQQNIKLYYNGVLQSSVATTAALLGSEKWLIGAKWDYTTSPNYLPTSVDEVRIWSRALTPCELYNHMHCELTGTQTGLVAYYKFNEGAASDLGNNATITSLTDASGNNYNGTLHNFALTGSSSNWILPGAITSGVSCAATTTYASTNNLAIYASQYPYSWNGLSFAAPGTKTATGLLSSYGCDSSATLVLTTKPDVVAAGLKLDGVNDYVELPSGLNSYYEISRITLEGWFNLGAGTTNATTLIGEAFLGDGKITFSIYRENNQIKAGFFDGSWHQVTAALPASGWNHIAATYDQQTIKLFYNGVLQGSLAVTLPLPAGTEKWLIGARWDYTTNADFLPTSVDEVRIWNKALTQCELLAHMNCELTGTQTGLLAYYKFNQGTDLGNNGSFTSLTDASGNNYNGTLHNFGLTGAASNWIFPGAVTTGVSCGAVPTYSSSNSLAIYTVQYPYTWNGLTFATPGTKTATVATALGCDSLATLVLTTKPDAAAAGLKFDGVNDYVELPSIINNQITGNHITVEGWFNLGTTSASFPTLIGEAFLGDGKIKFDLYKNVSGINAGFYDGSWHQVTVALPPSGWNHIAATYDQQTIKLYYNGVLQGSFATTLALPAGTEKWLLNSSWDMSASNFIPASMDEVRIWNRALDRCEILSHHNGELIGTETGLVAYYKFNQGMDWGNNTTITSLTDASGNNNNGTLHNFTLTGGTSNWTLPGGVTTGVSYVPIITTHDNITIISNQLPYQWKGLTFSAAGTQTGYFTNVAGCDSAVSTLTLKVIIAIPAISYSSSSHTYYKGNTISSLTPTNIGGAVPATVKGKTTIFAGSTSGASGTTNATGTAARFNMPSNIAKDASGNIYVSDLNNNLIRKITSAGIVTTFVGNGTPFTTAGNGTSAIVGNPGGLVFDASGNLFVVSQFSHQICKITPSGDVSIFAGSTQGYADGVGTAAKFYHPTGLTINSTGDLYVVDAFNNKIRKITSNGTVTTLAGSTEGYADGTGLAAQFRVPSDIVADASDNLIVVDYVNHKLRKITPLGVVTTLAGSTQGQDMGTGTLAQFNYPIAIARDNNDFYISQRYYGILKMNAATEVAHFAGNTNIGNVEGIGNAAKFSSPNGLVFDPTAGVVYVADHNNNCIKKVDAYDAYTISPALPIGLSMDITTGMITGTPTAVSANTIYTITAKNEGGSNSTTIHLEVILATPTISSFTPTTAGTGSVVTITGTNFTGATDVHFGGTAATSFTVVSATSITAVVASGANGIVSVTTEGGTATLAGFTYYTTLPLVWLDFTATAKSSRGKATEVLLNWKTANELNTKDFVVQRKANTGNWTDLGIVNALPNGISVAPYDFTDKMPTIGNNFYRLLHRDLDGQSNYSKVVNITISETAAMQIFPNPVNHGVLNIQLPAASMVTLFNADGQMVWKQQLSAGTHPINVSQFAKGMYLLFANGVSKKVIIE